MTTIAEIFTQKIATKLQNNPDLADSINASFLFDLTADDGGKWTVDLTEPPGKVSEGEIEDPNLIVTMTGEDFLKLVDGSLDAMKAFMGGKIKVKGNPNLALKLTQIIS